MSTKTTAGLQRTYRWVKLRQRIILLAGLIWFFTSLFLVSDSVDDSFGLVLLFLFAANLPTWIILRYNWRCPGCNTHLKFFQDNAICRCCGARLESPGSHSVPGSRRSH